MGLMKRASLSVLAGAVIGLTTMWAAAPSARADDIVLRMAVPDWPPTRIMKDLADKHYKAPSGNNVTLEPDFIPWPNYYERLAASLTSGEKKYQMAVSDSQWLGAFIEGGYYMKLDKFIDADPELQAIFKDLHPEPGRGLFDLSVQVEQPLRLPADAGRPRQLLSQGRLLQRGRAGDLQGEVRLQAALHAAMRWTISTGTCSRTIGEFFQRKAGDKLAGQTLDDDFYGIAFQAGKGYDFSSMQINGFIWQEGADIWDETKAPERPCRGTWSIPTPRSRPSITICR